MALTGQLNRRIRDADYNTASLPNHSATLLSIFKPSLLGLFAAITLMMVGGAFTESYYFSDHPHRYIFKPFPTVPSVFVYGGIIAIPSIILISRFTQEYNGLIIASLGSIILSITCLWFIWVGLSVALPFNQGTPKWAYLTRHGQAEGTCSQCTYGNGLIKIRFHFGDSRVVKSTDVRNKTFNSCVLVQEQKSFSGYQWLHVEREIDLGIFADTDSTSIEEIKQNCLSGRINSQVVVSGKKLL